MSTVNLSRSQERSLRFLMLAYKREGIVISESEWEVLAANPAAVKAEHERLNPVEPYDTVKLAQSYNISFA